MQKISLEPMSGYLERYKDEPFNREAITKQVVHLIITTIEVEFKYSHEQIKYYLLYKENIDGQFFPHQLSSESMIET